MKFAWVPCSFAVALLCPWSVLGQPGCGEPMGTCSVPLGTYTLALPQRTDGRSVPALLFFHGAGRSGAQTMREAGVTKAFTDRGYAVIAPDGLERPNSRFGPGWSFLPSRPAPT